MMTRQVWADRILRSYGIPDDSAQVHVLRENLYDIFERVHDKANDN